MASCRRSISTWCWNGCPIPKAIGLRSQCQANSCRTNITAPAATCLNMGSRKDNESALRSLKERCAVPFFLAAFGLIACLHLRDGHEQQFVHLFTKLLFAEGDVLRGQVCHDLAQD